MNAHIAFALLSMLRHNIHAHNGLFLGTNFLGLPIVQNGEASRLRD